MSIKSISLMITPNAASDMPFLLKALEPFEITSTVHIIRHFEYKSIYEAFIEAKSENSKFIISMLRLPFDDAIIKGAIFPKQDLDKINQYDYFQKHSIPTLKTLPFKFGMKYPGTLNDIITLKPAIMDTSHPHAMITLRNGYLNQLTPEHFHPDHPIRNNPYLVQEYMETSDRPTSYRVILFFGKPILAYKIVSHFDLRKIKNIKVHLGPEFISNNNFYGFDVELEVNSEALKIATDMSLCIGDPPLAICDLLFSPNKGWKALEISGNDFNGWPLGRRHLISGIGRNKMIEQFEMFDTIAKQINRITAEK